MTPVGWLESPYGAFRANPLYRLSGPETLAWSIPVYSDTDLRGLDFTRRELATIVASLRHWQGLVAPDVRSSMPGWFPGVVPLDDAEIDALCDRLGVTHIQIGDDPRLIRVRGMK
jgi:hypothetical protein